MQWRDAMKLSNREFLFKTVCWWSVRLSAWLEHSNYVDQRSESVFGLHQNDQKIIENQLKLFRAFENGQASKPKIVLNGPLDRWRSHDAGKRIPAWWSSFDRPNRAVWRLFSEIFSVKTLRWKLFSEDPSLSEESPHRRITLGRC